MSYPKTKKFNGKIYKFLRTSKGYGKYDAEGEAKQLRKTYTGVRVVFLKNRMPGIYVRG